MSTAILDPAENGLSRDLLLITEIYEAYRSRAGHWVTFLRGVKTSTESFLDADGNPIQYPPYQLIRDMLALLVPFSADLLTEIRRLQTADLFEKSDLYVRIENRAIANISATDQKGLFLLVGKAAEDHEVFDG